MGSLGLNPGWRRPGSSSAWRPRRQASAPCSASGRRWPARAWRLCPATPPRLASARSHTGPDRSKQDVTALNLLGALDEELPATKPETSGSNRNHVGANVTVTGPGRVHIVMLQLVAGRERGKPMTPVSEKRRSEFRRAFMTPTPWRRGSAGVRHYRAFLCSRRRLAASKPCMPVCHCRPTIVPFTGCSKKNAASPVTGNQISN